MAVKLTKTMHRADLQKNKHKLDTVKNKKRLIKSEQQKRYCYLASGLVPIKWWTLWRSMSNWFTNWFCGHMVWSTWVTVKLCALILRFTINWSRFQRLPPKNRWHVFRLRTLLCCCLALSLGLLRQVVQVQSSTDRGLFCWSEMQRRREVCPCVC